MPDRHSPGSPGTADQSTGSESSLDERLRAVERALTGTDRDLTELETAAQRADRVDEMERRLERIEDQVAELEAAVQAIRGYVGAIRAVNRDVERRADAALAAATGQSETDPPASARQETPAQSRDDVGSERDSGTANAGEWRPEAYRGDRPEGTDALQGSADRSSDTATPRETGDQSATHRPTVDDDEPGGSAGQSEGEGHSSTDDWPWEAEPEDVSPTDHGFEPVETAGPTKTGAADTAGTSAGATSTEATVSRSGSKEPKSPPDRSSLQTADGRSSWETKRPEPEGADASGSMGNARVSRSSESDGGEGFDWPPGDGMDVDRAEPWSAPDLPPADAPEEDRSLLERFREAL